MKRNIHLLQAAYILVWVVGALWALLSELDYLPTEYFPATPNMDYAVSLISIFTAIGGTWLALRLAAFKAVRRRLQEGETEQRQRYYISMVWWRTVIIAVAIWTNIVFYYGCSSPNTTQYCILIALIGALFCRPSRGECEGLTATQEQAKP